MHTGNVSQSEVDMTFTLLLGAGFSRNWGGWLADEVFEYLIGYKRITPPLRELLMRHKGKGGYEAALAELQEMHSTAVSPVPQDLDLFQDALSQMFSDLDTAFESVPFEQSNDRQKLVAAFLTKFDAIFTLNQDLLLERHYLNENVSLLSEGKWSGWTIPGMLQQSAANVEPLTNPNLGMWVPDGGFDVATNLQPYYKLHGSSNWFISAMENVMVIGGNKKSAIDRYPILKFYSEQFHEYLTKNTSRLMIIGYGFGDDHINKLIMDAVGASELTIFIVDPLGLDVMDKNRGATIHTPSALANTLWPRVIGVSKRPLSGTFNHDVVEHNKVMNFFDVG